MELLQGESLGDRLRRGGRLSTIEAARVARHALLSLAEAHDKGIVHRDLKPDNLFLVPAASDEGVTCKVLDFGIAKVVSDATFDASADAVETLAGTVFGTPRYMSPEQAQGKPLDGRSDLYSLGVLLYHMLVGQAPFVDDDAVVVMAHHIKSTPKSPELRAPEAAIPIELARLVMRALAKDPSGRPSSAREFMRELDHAMAIAAQHSAAETEQLGALVREGRARLLRSPATVAATLLIVSLAGAGLTARAFSARTPAPTAARIGVAATLAELTRIVQRDALAVVEASNVVTVPEPEPVASAAASASAGAPVAPVARSRPRGKQPPSSKKYTRFE
jgi:serine/threonine-protein kinase